MIKPRHSALISILQGQGEVNLATLVRNLKASEATIRRDLTRLENAGVLVRTHGGAYLLPEPSLVARTFSEKNEQMRAEKQLIARAAAELVRPGMAVALDSGTTVGQVSSALKVKAPLTVLTCSLSVVEELGGAEGISIHCTGGDFRLENLDFVGQAAVSAFGGLHADIAFISGDSMVSGKGLFALDEPSAAVASAIGACADTRVVVLDHAKFNAQGCRRVLSCDQIDKLVTDAGVSGGTRRQLQTEPFELIVAGE